MDTLSPEDRSKRMAKVRSKNTKPELRTRSCLHRLGFRFRLHVANLTGKPDITLPRWQVAIFVHGCFWHRHKGCQYTTTPQTNSAFWEEKFKSNLERDRRVIADLVAQGWDVIVVWECQTKTEASLRMALEPLLKKRGKLIEFD
ncbi:very short patch repair endonuclease [Cupriavidus alkaliphilus]|uniref:very short patch repair endonuclease n=1 Tax=Cupriavidus alkaliphilus TaxID=942866 RepID=UPI00161DC73B|nr:DNA mismatch endonuclease Vsr [Cupriavidus alkaliphilus]